MFISLRQGKHGCASFQLVSALTMFVLALYHANRTFFFSKLPHSHHCIWVLVHVAMIVSVFTCYLERITYDCHFAL